MFLRLIKLSLFLSSLFSCSQNKNPKFLSTGKSSPDTSIHSEIVIHGFFWPSEQRKEKSYYVVINKDTSKSICILSENKFDDDFSYKGTVGMRIYFDETKSYGQQLTELEKIFQVAAKEFLFDSLKGITISLWEAGDLAITITNQMSGDDRRNVSNNMKTAEFLLKSKLSTDMNRLFAPYKKKVKNFAVEHPGLSDSSVITENSVIETPRDQIPSRILAGTVWVHF